VSAPDSLPHTQRPPTLYSLTDEYRQALQELEYCDPAEPEDAKRVVAVLDMLKDEIAIKAPAVAGRIAELETFAEMVRDASNRMAMRALRITQRAASLKAYLLSNLLALPEKQRKQESEEISVAVRKNPPAVQIAAGVALPDEYMRDPLKVELPTPVYRALLELYGAVGQYDATPFDDDPGLLAASDRITKAVASIKRMGLPNIERLPNKTLISEDLKAGKEIPGCALPPSYRLHIE
jgi:hypothetical protein